MELSVRQVSDFVFLFSFFFGGESQKDYRANMILSFGLLLINREGRAEIREKAAFAEKMNGACYDLEWTE